MLCYTRQCTKRLTHVTGEQEPKAPPQDRCWIFHAVLAEVERPFGKFHTIPTDRQEILIKGGGHLELDRRT